MADQFCVPESIAVRVPVDRRRAQTETTLTACGLTVDDATTAGDVLMDIDERGIVTHGVMEWFRAVCSELGVPDLLSEPSRKGAS